MRTAEVASQAGVNVETLRYYERRGLLPEPRRRDSGYRIYSDDTVHTVRFIKQAQQLGFSLEEVGALLDLAAGGPRSCDAARELATSKVSHLNQKIVSLENMRGSLVKLIETCSRPQEDRECPLLVAFASEHEEKEQMMDHVCSPTLGDSAFGPDTATLVPTIVRKLVEGPVTIDELAAGSGVSAAEIEANLRAQAGTEWDNSGRIIGFGLTSRPTEHRLAIAGKVFYTWCAADTLLFPIILGEEATIDSRCPSTGNAIHIEVTPDRVLEVDPPSVVVSQRMKLESVVTGSAAPLLSDVRGAICDNGHFFVSQAEAAGWLNTYPEGTVTNVSGAFDELHRSCEKLGWLGAKAHK